MQGPEAKTHHNANAFDNPLRAPELPPSTVQFVERPGIIDLSLGQPDPVLLPVSDLQLATHATLDAYGPEAIGYGYPAGSGPLVEWVCERLAATDSRAPRPSEVLVTAGTSQALDQVMTLLCEPGDVVLVESPTYHLAVRIFRDHPVRLMAVPSDADGLSVDALEHLVAQLRQQGMAPRLLYTVPTHHNPTGQSLGLKHRIRIVDLAVREGITVVEDDAYRELAFEGLSPPSLWSLDPGSAVIRLGTFSKSIAPGLRVGFLTANKDIVARFANGGLLDSGGGNSHFVGMVVSTFGRSGAYARTVGRFVAAYAARLKALLDPLKESSLDDLSWTTPAGGYFTWLTFGEAIDTQQLLRTAEGLGTSFALGTNFYVNRDGGENCARLAFTRYDEQSLHDAGRLIVRAIKLSSTRKTW